MDSDLCNGKKNIGIQNEDIHESSAETKHSSRMEGWIEENNSVLKTVVTVRSKKLKWFWTCQQTIKQYLYIHQIYPEGKCGRVKKETDA